MYHHNESNLEDVHVILQQDHYPNIDVKRHQKYYGKEKSFMLYPFVSVESFCTKTPMIPLRDHPDQTIIAIDEFCRMCKNCMHMH